MPALAFISASHTVKQVADAFPACARVLERWPMARCDGRWTLQQLGPFARQPLASTRLMLASAVLIVIGNAARVTLELATIGGSRWSYRAMGMTGVLELTALILFAINVAATARNRRRVYSGAHAPAPETRVQELVNVRPGVQRRLRELGVTMFDEAAFIAPSMTIGALALSWGMQPSELIQKLAAA